ncbi:hypothetical protein BSL78_17034 [Apostichopus japonicus]|uniref:Uncharacterized protein n=1 Tax=Stichopus japonicus TaxID=307972 RepID=A0A2G8KDQ3_STIJA|nr:hypothetical protein BSL78_17034 [Apostichopus japonicus]
MDSVCFRHLLAQEVTAPNFSAYCNCVLFFFILFLACVSWPSPRPPPPPPPYRPPPRPPPPPPVRPTTISACPPSQDLTSNRGETTRKIAWNAPQITNGSPPYNVVRTGPESGSEFDCNGEPTKVCYYAEGRGGRSATCCFNVQCSIIECSEIGEIDSGVVECTNGNAFGSVCTFQCDDGFILEGPTVSVCEESGMADPAVEWTNDKPTCQHAACPILQPPLHGSFALHKSSFAEIAFQQCQEGWEVPRVAMAMSYTGEFHCSFGTDWQPSTVYDCSETSRPGRMRILNELQYYSGNCEDDQTKKAIATNFVQQINQETTNRNLQDVWKNCGSCGVEDVTVECRIESRRRKRDSAPSTDEYVLDIKFYLSMDVPASNSHEKDIGELFDMKGLLSNVSKEIADQATDGHIVPEVPGLQLTLHDVPVIYHEVNPVCESGFASNRAKLNCVACPWGTFNDETESVCIPCPVGQYQNKTKRTTCNKCDEGMSTIMEGSVNITECIDLCPAGTSSPTGFQPCSRCNETSVQPQMGQQSCLPCGEREMKSQTSEKCILHSIGLFDGCTEGYCENGGTCQEPYLTCKCPSTATGARCETLIACLPIPTVEQGFLECDDNDEHLFNCTHHCNENNLPSVATLSTYNCGTSTFCYWNYESPINRNRILPSCVEPEIPDNVTLTYHSTYPGLSCTKANQNEVKTQINEWANDICSGVCDAKTVTVEGCPGKGKKRTPMTGVRKVVTVTAPYDARGGNMFLMLTLQ